MKFINLLKMDWIKHLPIAHRGLHNDKISENSREAFKSAAINNYAIECDVVLSKDHEVVVIHDENLKRLCSTNLNVSDLYMSELREFTINNTESNIISLDEMLHIVNASVPIIIEIKGNYSPYIENRIYEIIRSYTGKVAIKSFNIAYIQWICEFLPFLTKGLIVDRNNNNNLSILDMNLDFISCDIDFIDSNFMSKVRKKNIPIITWTVDSFEKKQKAKMYSDNIIFEKIVP